MKRSFFCMMCSKNNTQFIDTEKNTFTYSK